MTDDWPTWKYVAAWTIGVVGVIVATLALIVALWVGVGSAVGAYHRSQNLKNAQNHIHVVERQVKQQQAQVEVVKQQAEQRYQEAIGIKRAQDEINSTLTPLYVQHEAIQAQLAIANSGRNNTIIYVPSGSVGTPIVQTTDPAAIAARDQAGAGR